jgi:RNA polymerase sigma-54 factor
MQQQQSQRQQQKINPQQVQFLNFLQLSRQEIEQTLREELETNPFLEKTEDSFSESDDFDKDMHAEDKDTYQDEDTLVEVGINDAKIQREYKDLMHLNRAHEDFRKRLKNDVALLSSDKKMVAFAEYLIDCLNNDGMLPETTEDIADNLSFLFQKLVTEVEIVKALELVQMCEPAGVPAYTDRQE